MEKAKKLAMVALVAIVAIAAMKKFAPETSAKIGL